MKKKITFFLVIFSLVFSFKGKADHLLGGEVTWDCLTTGPNAGKFVFRLIIYRFCPGWNDPTTASLNVQNHPSLTSIAMIFDSLKEVSPVCVPGSCTGQTQIHCATAPYSQAGATEERWFHSAPITINGTPPLGGWVFTYDFCCRNAIDNISGGSFTLRAIMYAYDGKNTNPCFDSSPRYLEPANSVICSGYQFNYNHNSQDPEQDSLHFSWADPVQGYTGSTPNPITWSTNYSTNVQLPGPAVDPANSGATIDPSTGEISFTSFTNGNFVTCTRVQAFRCGQLIAETFRDIQVALLACPLPYVGANANEPPLVNKPFYNGTRYDTAVFAGDSVCFDILAEDQNFKCSFTNQNVTIQASGGQFSLPTYQNTASGCTNPPCAILTPPPGDPLVTNFPQGAYSRFCWQTECQHIGFVGNICNSATSRYIFIIKVLDDYCPAPGLNMLTVAITVKDRPHFDVPYFHCTQVQANAGGNVQLLWYPTGDIDTANSFDQYLIWGATSKNGPYSVIGTYDKTQINATSYLDIAGNANNGPLYYFIQSVSGCYLDRMPSDTLSTIYLSLSSINTTQGTKAQLNWNAVANPNLPSNSGLYYIYREINGASFALIDSVFDPTGANMLYIDENSASICNKPVRYRIEVKDALGCRSISNTPIQNFGQTLPPAVPTITDFTVVDAAGNVSISWTPNTEPDLAGYYLYTSGNGINSWNLKATIVASSFTGNYSDLNPLVNSQTQYYMVLAYDTCGYLSDTGLVQKTIYQADSLNTCNGTFDLTWDNFQGWAGGVSGYELYVSINNGAYNLEASLGNTVFSYILSNLQNNSTYCFYIKAIGSGIENSRSNIVCILADLPNFPRFLYLRTASVVDVTKSVSLLAYVDRIADVQQYNIYRSLSPNDPYSQVGSADPSDSVLTYNDAYSIAVDANSYYYKITAVGTCGTEVLTSNVSRTIHLASAADDNYIYNNLYWNEYEGWSTGVFRYNIYRIMDSDPPQLIASLHSTDASYHDDISDLTQASGNFCYYIEAIESNGNVYGFKDSSLSNEFCLIQHPTVFVPSAFNPDGVGKTFKPVTTYLETSQYEFKVFNRWGQVVFETSHKEDGWDGTYAGTAASEGVYVYVVKYKSTRVSRWRKKELLPY